MANDNCALVWHRRDLRIDDNASIELCLSNGHRPIGVFVFDEAILAPLRPNDARVEFIQESVGLLAREYAKYGLDFLICHGNPNDQIPKLASERNAACVFAGRDYEPVAKNRDEEITRTLIAAGKAMFLSKDHVVFESHEIKTQTGGHYAVFTPYKNAWLKQFVATPPIHENTAEKLKRLALPPAKSADLPTLNDLGFSHSACKPVGLEPGEIGARRATKAFATKISQYKDHRDLPDIDGTSRLGPHLRFGTVSVRRLAIWAQKQPGEGAQTWLSEIIWREFYSMILDIAPRIADGESFQRPFDGLTWSNIPERIAAWKQGRTGIPVVDAGMRELRETGHMHNRVRMIAASYLVKHLDCDWRLGEAHFAKLLLDYDFASNNGGWQWSASTGCDAQPYFRIFNPALQSERFDPQGKYIARWVPELGSCPAKFIHKPDDFEKELALAGISLGKDYPRPLIVHAKGRENAIAKYAAIAKGL
jgi:deoxyribodipyrimidine photo-lyase